MRIKVDWKYCECGCKGSVYSCGPLSFTKFPAGKDGWALHYSHTYAGTLGGPDFIGDTLAINKEVRRQVKKMVSSIRQKVQL